jgi:hypothetical protein
MYPRTCEVPATAVRVRAARQVRIVTWPGFHPADLTEPDVWSVDKREPNDYVVFMLPAYTDKGVLPPGVHNASWDELAERFGGSPRRDSLLRGLLEAAGNLRSAGARVIWLGGSFVTDKEEPDDWDGVWDPSNADMTKVDPVLIDPADLATGRHRQKAKYAGELLVGVDAASGSPFQLYFQVDKNGDPKGIIRLDLRTLP